MTDAPERIVIAGTLEECGNYYPTATEAEGEHGGFSVEYVRLDIHAAALAEVERLRADVPDYDAGLLNDWGGGNVEWWQDYIRAEIGRANDHWRAALEAKP
jgi:hypothetical protein